MSISLQNERDNIYRLEISGLLKQSDLKQCEAELAGEIGRIGHVKLLFVLKDFEGWESNADWNDLTFYVRHGSDVDQIAIVGDDKWRSQALMFTAAGLRRASVQFFSAGGLASARAWLSMSSPNED